MAGCGSGTVWRGVGYRYSVTGCGEQEQCNGVLHGEQVLCNRVYTGNSRSVTGCEVQVQCNRVWVRYCITGCGKQVRCNRL